MSEYIEPSHTSNNIHSKFGNMVSRHPEKTALICGSESWSYAMLDARSAAIARSMLASGVVMGDLVAIRMDRSLELIAAMIAVLKCGAAFVPIDPDLPISRAVEMLGDSEASLLVARRHGDLISDASVATLVLDDDGRNFEPPREISKPHHKLDEDDERYKDASAYVIYTSGSTGIPKGVVVTHKNVLRLFSSTQHLFEFGESSVWSVLHSPGFDFSVWEIWGALLYGGTAIIYPAATASDITSLALTVASDGISMLSFTPGAFSLFSRAATDQKIEFRDLKFVVLGGEKVEPSHVANWALKYPLIPLINMYGITEITVHATFKRLEQSHVLRGETLSIGRPLNDLMIFLLDDLGNQVADGDIGEIAIAGAGVALGYLNRPGLTAARFPTYPIGDGGAPVRVYLSGDLARRQDGELFYEGRMDSQVKVRGYRVELGEVSACIAKLPGVADCITIKQSLDADDCRLVSFAIPEKSWPGEAVVMEGAAMSLPAYMRPSILLAVDKYPLTRNGKIDTASLLALLTNQKSASATGNSDPIIEIIATFAAKILRANDLSIEDELIDQGATSLSLVRLLLEVNRHFSTNLTGIELDGDSSIVAIAKAAKAATAIAPVELVHAV